MESRSLQSEAEAFALRLTGTVKGVLGEDAPGFVAELAPRRSPEEELTVVLVHPERSEEISLTIDGVRALAVAVDYECAWDHRRLYLKVSSADICVTSVDSAEPLFRFEFDSKLQDDLPSAHIQVHGHRDEVVYQYLRGGSQRGKRAVRSVIKGASGSKKPSLSRVHLPVGGPRMRPALEDVLQMLKVEFGIDFAAGYREVLETGRADWRRSQIGALTRDAPETAARVLEEMGWTVLPPADHKPVERTSRLRRF